MALRTENVGPEIYLAACEREPPALRAITGPGLRQMVEVSHWSSCGSFFAQLWTGEG